MQHFTHVANRHDVWYVANGWLYCYRYVAQHAKVSSASQDVSPNPYAQQVKQNVGRLRSDAAPARAGAAESLGREASNVARGTFRTADPPGRVQVVATTTR